MSAVGAKWGLGAGQESPEDKMRRFMEAPSDAHSGNLYLARPHAPPAAALANPVPLGSRPRSDSMSSNKSAQVGTLGPGHRGPVQLPPTNAESFTGWRGHAFVSPMRVPSRAQVAAHHHPAADRDGFLQRRHPMRSTVPAGGADNGFPGHTVTGGWAARLGMSQASGSRSSMPSFVSPVRRPVPPPAQPVLPYGVSVPKQAAADAQRGARTSGPAAPSGQAGGMPLEGRSSSRGRWRIASGHEAAYVRGADGSGGGGAGGVPQSGMKLTEGMRTRSASPYVGPHGTGQVQSPVGIAPPAGQAGGGVGTGGAGPPGPPRASDLWRWGRRGTASTNQRPATSQGTRDTSRGGSSQKSREWVQVVHPEPPQGGPQLAKRYPSPTFGTASSPDLRAAAPGPAHAAIAPLPDQLPANAVFPQRGPSPGRVVYVGQRPPTDGPQHGAPAPGQQPVVPAWQTAAQGDAERTEGEAATRAAGPGPVAGGVLGEQGMLTPLMLLQQQLHQVLVTQPRSPAEQQEQIEALQRLKQQLEQQQHHHQQQAREMRAKSHHAAQDQQQQGHVSPPQTQPQGSPQKDDEDPPVHPLALVPSGRAPMQISMKPLPGGAHAPLAVQHLHYGPGSVPVLGPGQGHKLSVQQWQAIHLQQQKQLSLPPLKLLQPHERQELMLLEGPSQALILTPQSTLEQPQQQATQGEPQQQQLQQKQLALEYSQQHYAQQHQKQQQQQQQKLPTQQNQQPPPQQQLQHQLQQQLQQYQQQYLQQYQQVYQQHYQQSLQQQQQQAQHRQNPQQPPWHEGGNTGILPQAGSGEQLLLEHQQPMLLQWHEDSAGEGQGAGNGTSPGSGTGAPLTNQPQALQSAKSVFPAPGGALGPHSAQPAPEALSPPAGPGAAGSPRGLPMRGRVPGRLGSEPKWPKEGEEEELGEEEVKRVEGRWRRQRKVVLERKGTGVATLGTRASMVGKSLPRQIGLGPSSSGEGEGEKEGEGVVDSKQEEVLQVGEELEKLREAAQVQCQQGTVWGQGSGSPVSAPDQESREELELLLRNVRRAEVLWAAMQAWGRLVPAGAGGGKGGAALKLHPAGTGPGTGQHRKLGYFPHIPVALSRSASGSQKLQGSSSSEGAFPGTPSSSLGTGPGLDVSDSDKEGAVGEGAVGEGESGLKPQARARVTFDVAASDDETEAEEGVVEGSYFLAMSGSGGESEGFRGVRGRGSRAPGALSRVFRSREMLQALVEMDRRPLEEPGAPETEDFRRDARRISSEKSAPSGGVVYGSGCGDTASKVAGSEEGTHDMVTGEEQGGEKGGLEEDGMMDADEEEGVEEESIVEFCEDPPLEVGGLEKGLVEDTALMEGALPQEPAVGKALGQESLVVKLQAKGVGLGEDETSEVSKDEEEGEGEGEAEGEEIDEEKEERKCELDFSAAVKPSSGGDRERSSLVGASERTVLTSFLVQFVRALESSQAQRNPELAASRAERMLHYLGGLLLKHLAPVQGPHPRREGAAAAAGALDTCNAWKLPDMKEMSQPEEETQRSESGARKDAFVERELALLHILAWIGSQSAAANRGHLPLSACGRGPGGGSLSIGLPDRVTRRFFAAFRGRALLCGGQGESSLGVALVLFHVLTRASDEEPLLVLDHFGDGTLEKAHAQIPLASADKYFVGDLVTAVMRGPEFWCTFTLVVITASAVEAVRRDLGSKGWALLFGFLHSCTREDAVVVVEQSSPCATQKVVECGGEGELELGMRQSSWEVRSLLIHEGATGASETGKRAFVMCKAG